MTNNTTKISISDVKSELEVLNLKEFRAKKAEKFAFLQEKLQLRAAEMPDYDNSTKLNTYKQLKKYLSNAYDFKYDIVGNSIRKKIIASYSLKQCLFGLHLVPLHPQKTVAAVESEKTAIIMSLILPDYLWLSYGGLNNIFQLNTPVLQGRKIIVFPDAGTYNKLQPKIAELIAMGFNIYMSNLLETKATEAENGYDLADYAILNEWYKTNLCDGG